MRASEEALDRVTEAVRSVEIDAAPGLARAAAERARTGATGVADRLAGALVSFRQPNGPAQPGTGDKAAPGTGDEAEILDDRD